MFRFRYWLFGTVSYGRQARFFVILSIAAASLSVTGNSDTSRQSPRPYFLKENQKDGKER